MTIKNNVQQEKKKYGHSSLTIEYTSTMHSGLVYL